MQCRKTVFTNSKSRGSRTVCSELPSNLFAFAKQSLEGLELADDFDNFNNTESIDVLIGSDYYWDFVSGGSIKDNQGLTAVYSKFGWLLSRPIHNQSFNLIISGGCNSMFEEQDEKLVESLKKFWESESVGIITQDHSLHADKQKPEIHFNGHNYKIGLPWKEDLQPSMNSYRLSETQL